MPLEEPVHSQSLLLRVLKPLPSLQMLAEETQIYRQKMHTGSGDVALMTHAAPGMP